MITVGANEFVFRQAKRDFVGTKLRASDILAFQNIATIALNFSYESSSEEERENMKYVSIQPGYADFVREVIIVGDVISEFRTPIARITNENFFFLKTKYETRSGDERDIPHLVRYFPRDSVETLPAKAVRLILYSREQLVEEKSSFTGSDWDLISVNAEPYEESVPMVPFTLIRNALGSEFGGSGVKLCREDYAKSVSFWERHAMVE